MKIPIRAIRSLHTVPKDLSRKLGSELSIHGLLAAELALQRNDTADWASLVPQWTDFENTVPMLWPEELQQLLPAEAKHLLKQQCSRFECEWTVFRKVFSNEIRREYLYAWLLVNTRTFYFETPAMLKSPWHDRLALLPIADLFNHADTGCAVSFSTDQGYSITADRHYRQGDEIHTSYGDHSNDFLLTEYGFLLRGNRWDKLCLDDILLPRMSSRQKSELEQNHPLGDLTLHTDSKKSDKIWIALRVLCCAKPQWRSYMDGEEDDEGTLSKAVKLLPVVLDEYLGMINDALAVLRTLRIGKACQKDLLVQRWEEIAVLSNRIIKTNKWVGA